MPRTKLLAGVLPLILVTVSCGTVDSAESDAPPELTVDESTPKAGAEAITIDPDSLGPGMQRLVDLAIEDAVQRFSVEADDIKVVSAEFVTWPDTSAGCPRPDMQYMQAIVNGSRIVLMTPDQKLNYHSGGNRPPFFCPKPSGKPVSPYNLGET